MEKEANLKIPDIIVKELNQETNLEEKKILQEWLLQSEDNRLLYERLKQKENLYAVIKEHDKIDSLSAWEKISKRTSKRNNQFKIVLSVLKYAAVITIPLLIAAYLIYQDLSGQHPVVSYNKMEEQINKLDESSLILDDGTVVSLVTESKGDSIIEIDGTHITKDESEILYSENNTSVEKEVKFNTLVTPKSKVFNVVLADGTKVWLNASSAIRYPMNFSSNIRKVYLTGEAYFEVTKDSTKPFIVSTNDMEIEVLGTSFNVMAYPEDDDVETTLVQGEVKVKTSKHYLILKPGKQAKLDKISENLKDMDVNTELFTSWKAGKYIFEYENLDNVMTKLSRWYDVQIFYLNDKVRNLHFSGTLFKYSDIRQTLHIIELATDVKFEVVENAVLVNRK